MENLGVLKIYICFKYQPKHKSIQKLRGKKGQTSKFQTHKISRFNILIGIADARGFARMNFDFSENRWKYGFFQDQM